MFELEEDVVNFVIRVKYFELVYTTQVNSAFHAR